MREKFPRREGTRYVPPPRTDVDEAKWKYKVIGNNLFAAHPEAEPHIWAAGSWVDISTLSTDMNEVCDE